jgi:hypothetical protein
MDYLSPAHRRLIAGHVLDSTGVAEAKTGVLTWFNIRLLVNDPIEAFVTGNSFARFN